MSKCDLLPQSTIFQVVKNKNHPLALVLLIICIMLLFPASSFAQRVASCGCYCGKTTSPPCSDAKCKQACGYKEPLSGGGGGSYSPPAYDYEAERQRQQEIEEENRRIEEEKKRNKEKFEKNKREALESMKGITDNELGLKGSASGDLGLKGISDEKLGIKDASSYDTENLTRKKSAVKIKVDKKTQQSTPFQKGLRDASECYEPNGKVYCLSVPAEDQSKCTELYEMGFNSGMVYQETLLDGATFYGKQDGEGGKKNQSFNHPDAKGPCRVKWIESYHNGYFAGKAASKSKR